MENVLTYVNVILLVFVVVEVSVGNNLESYGSMVLVGAGENPTGWGITPAKSCLNIKGETPHKCLYYGV